MTTLRANDARNRAVRTFLQGLVADVIAAVVLLVLPVFSNATGCQDVDWKVLGFLLAKTVTVTALSFLMRQYLDPSRLPTPLPPSDPGEPDDDVHDLRILGKALYSDSAPTVQKPGGMRARTTDPTDPAA